MSDDRKPKSRAQVGGQAVIEGVMMRSSERVAVAVRRPDGSILVRRQPYTSWTRRWFVLSWPLLRGAVVLVESLILGIRALAFSADVATEDSRNDRQDGRLERQDGLVPKAQRGWWSKLWLAGTVVFSLGAGLGLFFYVPLLLTEFTGVRSGVMFNIVDGGFRLAIFLLYLALIARLPDIKRIFEYHGAEHKSIFAYEDNGALTPVAAEGYSRLHPRCGTSFLLIVMLVSIFVFMALGRPEGVGERLLRLALVPVIGGLSYELIRLSARGARHRVWRLFIEPGLWLQKITTREPNQGQLEVAIIALKGALDEDMSGYPNVVFEEGSRGQRVPVSVGVS